jgi:cyclopropane-fatty-acyl-phospholipid synthase
MTDRAARVRGLACPVRTFSSDVAPLASTALDRWALELVRRSVASASIRFILWDGFEIAPVGAPVATITFKNRRALLGLVYDSDLNFGEAYMCGAMEVRGDLPALLEAVYRARPQAARRLFWRHRRSNDLRAARENVHGHYDLGSTFYRLWLDPELVYTCAYFPEPTAALEAAQIAKMDLVCRKLRLTPGERVVEAGCGWGALALYMARQYGVRVRAFNVSSEQIAYARDRASRESLDGRVEFIEDDYRSITGTFDAFVSVGMLEHVGLPDFPALGCVVDKSIGRDGRGLLHFIGRNRPAALNPWIRKRIFPGAYPPTLREVCEHVLEPHDFSLTDVENLRLHYAKTIEHWLRRFEASAGKVAQMFDEAFVRAWRLYLAGSQAAFTAGSMQLFQIMFARGATNRIPWTRATS